MTPALAIRISSAKEWRVGDLVYPSEFIADVQKRWAGVPEGNRPDFYRLCVTERGQQTRDEIEAWVRNVDADETTLRKLVADLRSEKGWRHAYHHLAVKVLLEQRALAVQFEPDIEGLKPDLMASKGAVTLCVEVFSLDAPKQQRLHLARVLRLFEALSEIPEHVRIRISSIGRDLLEDADIALITDGVRSWLSLFPSPASAITLEDWEVTLLARFAGPGHVQAVGPTHAYVVNTDSLAKTLKAKVKKYAKVLDQRHMPLVIAVVPDFQTGIEADDLENVLWGQEVFTAQLNRQTGRLEGGHLARRADGRGAKSPQLSAMLLVTGSPGSWRMVVRHNPNALHPVPEEYLQQNPA